MAMTHSRRRFIQQCAAVVGGATMTRAMTDGQTGADGPALTNWSGNLRYSTSSLTSASSVACCSMAWAIQPAEVKQARK